MSLTTRDTTGSAEADGIPVPGPGYYDLQNSKTALSPTRVYFIASLRIKIFSIYLYKLYA